MVTPTVKSLGNASIVFLKIFSLNHRSPSVATALCVISLISSLLDGPVSVIVTAHSYVVATRAHCLIACSLAAGGFMMTGAKFTNIKDFYDDKFKNKDVDTIVDTLQRVGFVDVRSNSTSPRKHHST